MKKAFALWIFSILLIACGRISSKERLETITEIQLPAGYTVLADNYQKMGEDFYLQYNLKFNADSTRQMIEAIRSSKFYSPAHTQILYDSVWYEDKNLYKFEARNNAGDKKYSISFDPASGLLNYVEYSERMKL